MKPFEFEREPNIGDINSSSSDNDEEDAEAVAWRCSAKKGVLRNFTGKFTGNTYAGVFFLEPFIKKESLTLVFFCEFCEHLSKNTIFYRTPQVAASVKAYNFAKIRLRYGCFLVNFLKIFGTFF